MKSPNQIPFEFAVDEEAFPVRFASEKLDIEAFNSRISRAMAKAIRQCPHDRSVIAARMAQYLGVASISRGTLDAYTAESKPHVPNLPRFKAFVFATGATWLWDEVIKDEGLTILAGEEAILAQIGLMRQEREELTRQLNKLIRERVHVKDIRR